MKKQAMNSSREDSLFSSVAIKEDFLHYIWKYKLFRFENLKSVFNEEIQLYTTGLHNMESGPDFFNAQLKIDDQLWAGNVEIHIKSSDWYAHKHEQDINYDAVILHVVWEYDVPVFRKNGSEIPTLILKDVVFHEVVESYSKFIEKERSWILCEKDIGTLDSFLLDNWFSRLYIERLEHKSKLISELLKKASNDWEAVLFQMLAKNFGMKLNGEAFLDLAHSFDFSVLKKQRQFENGIEILLLGQAGFFEDDKEDVYFLNLKKEYEFVKHKYKLQPIYNGRFLFFRLRPANFPTIRISQLAQLYEIKGNLFSELMEFSTLEDYYDFFKIGTSEYWDTHYVFGKETKVKKKKLTKSFVDLLLINTILPLRYTYEKNKGQQDFEFLEDMIQKIKPEKNTVIEKFTGLKVSCENAMQSQALLQLKNEYCDRQKCLECRVGLNLLK